MSRLIDTDLGQFRAVKDGENQRFLFQCPDCDEFLPLDEETLAGKKPIIHESGKFAASYCTFQGVREFGKVLVSTMQAMIAMGYRPYHDEGEDRWQPAMAGSETL